MELVMYASLLTAVVLCLVGLIKLPLIRFKGRPFYKTGLTLLTIVLTLGACVLCQLYVIEEELISVGMLYLVLMTFGEVALSYNYIYEGCHIKTLFKNLFINLGNVLAKRPESKLVKSAEKYGLNEAIKHLSELAEKRAEEQKVAEEKAKIEANNNQPVEVR